MLSCAAAALSAATGARPAGAPSGAFRGNIASTSGTVTRSPLTNTTETITVGSPTATINWTPTDTAQGGGTIDFLPNGNVATFTGAAGLADYTVLNRIVPTDATRPIGLNGQVLSTLAQRRDGRQDLVLQPRRDRRRRDRRVRRRQPAADHQRRFQPVDQRQRILGKLHRPGVFDVEDPDHARERRSTRSSRTATSRWSPRGSSKAAR